MASPMDKLARDGFVELSGGVDGGRAANLIERNQVASATNATFRGGKLAPRPGLVKRFGYNNFLDSQGQLTQPEMASAFLRSRFQHGSFFDGTQKPMLISSQGGRQFAVDLRTWTAQEITPSTGRNSSALTKGWSCQVENYWIYQDNQSLPIIFDGARSRRADPAKSEVPVGNVMAYAMGRLVVALPNRTTFRVGDLVFSSSGTMEHGFRDAVLRFTENAYANEGGDFTTRFAAPSGYGQITAMHPTAMQDTALGQGPLIVGTPYCVFTVQLPFDRTIWKSLRSPIQTVSPIMGPTGQDTCVLVNCDLWYRSLDGVRSYIMAQRQFQGVGNTPMSTEVSPFLRRDAQRLLEHGSGVLWDNRLITTVAPVDSGYGVWHRALVICDFDLVSTMRSKAAPAWEGIWTGLRFLKIVKGLVDGQERCFVYALNDSDEIEIWEFDKLSRVDKGDGGDNSIAWTADLGSWDFKNGFMLKRLETGEIYIDELWGAASLAVKFRSDQNPCWLSWQTFDSLCATKETCWTDNAGCAAPSQLRPQFRSKLKLYQPPDTMDTINGRKYRTGYEFQARLENVGYFHLKQARFGAGEEPEASHAERVVV